MLCSGYTADSLLLEWSTSCSRDAVLEIKWKPDGYEMCSYRAVQGECFQALVQCRARNVRQPPASSICEISLARYLASCLHGVTASLILPSSSLCSLHRILEWVSGIEIRGNETSFQVGELSTGVLYHFRLTVAGGRSTGLLPAPHACARANDCKNVNTVGRQAVTDV